jgi:hypothetical protein
MILSIIAFLIIMKSLWPDIDFTSGSYRWKKPSGYELRAGEVQDAKVGRVLGALRPGRWDGFGADVPNLITCYILYSSYGKLPLFIGKSDYINMTK